MITADTEKYTEDNFIQDNQSYVDLYQQENEEENLLYKEETSEPTENENLDTAFSNALDLDEFENDSDENDPEEETPKENEEDENHDQEEITEPETFADDGYKID